jgi:hypothetical protein
MISWAWLILATLGGAVFGLAVGMACAAAGQAERCEECRREPHTCRTCVHTDACGGKDDMPNEHRCWE